MLAHVRELTYPYRTACRKNRIANDALFARCPAPTPKSEDRKDIRPSAPASSERMRTGFRILMPNPSAGPAIGKLPSPDGTFPDFATSPTRIPHPYKVQHFPNRSGRRSRRPAIRPSRTGPFVVAAPALRDVPFAGRRRNAPTRPTLSGRPSAALPVPQATAPSVLEPHLSETTASGRLFGPEAGCNTTSSPSSHPGSDRPKPSLGTGYG